MNAASAASLIATTRERRFGFLGARKAAGRPVVVDRKRHHNVAMVVAELARTLG
jgi:hypothetical protein